MLEKSQIPEGCFIVKSLPQYFCLENVLRGFVWSPSTRLITLDGNFSEYGPEAAVLYISLRPISPKKDILYDLMTVSVRVRRLYSFRHRYGVELVTCCIKYSNSGQTLGGADRLPVRVLATIEKQDVFSQKAFVMEVFEWQNEPKSLKRRLLLL